MDSVRVTRSRARQLTGSATPGPQPTSKGSRSDTAKVAQTTGRRGARAVKIPSSDVEKKKLQFEPEDSSQSADAAPSLDQEPAALDHSTEEVSSVETSEQITAPDADIANDSTPSPQQHTEEDIATQLEAAMELVPDCSDVEEEQEDVSNSTAVPVPDASTASGLTIIAEDAAAADQDSPATNDVNTDGQLPTEPAAVESTPATPALPATPLAAATPVAAGTPSASAAVNAATPLTAAAKPATPVTVAVSFQPQPTSGATPTVTKTAKRVSICTPVACEPLSAPRQTLRRTPYPKGPSTEPASDEGEAEDEMMEEQEEAGAEATEAPLPDDSVSTSPARPSTPDVQPVPTPAAAAHVGGAGIFGSPVAPATALNAEPELEEEPSVADMVEAAAASDDADASDAAMAIAAARRQTCEVEHLSEAAAAPAEDLAMSEVDEEMEEEEEEQGTPAEAATAAPPTPVPAPVTEAAEDAAATPGVSELPEEEEEDFTDDVVAASATPLASESVLPEEDEEEAAPAEEEEEEAGFVPGPVRPVSVASGGDKYALAHAALQSRAAAEAAHGSRPSSSPAPGSRTPSYMQPTAAARLKSKVVVTETYDGRSLGEIRRQIKAVAGTKTKAPTLKTQVPEKLAQHKKVAAVEENDDGDDGREAAYDQAAEDVLTAAMSTLAVNPAPASSKPAPLRGVPAPQGRHIRFTSKGKAKESPSNERTLLRGVPTAAGKHIRFE